MALTRLVIDGFGQLELNNVAFRRNGRVEAQLPLDATDFATVPAENGMLLVVDRVQGVIRKPKASETLPVGLVYTSEHLYDERYQGLKNFKTEAKNDFYPRLGYPAVGDKFTTNCVSYDTTDFTDEDKLIEGLEAIKTTALYGGQSTDGSIKISKTAPTSGIKLIVIEKTTMPDGQLGIKFQVIGA